MRVQVFARHNNGQCSFQPYRLDIVIAIFSTIAYVLICFGLFVGALIEQYLWFVLLPIVALVWMIPAYYYWRARFRVAFSNCSIDIYYGKKQNLQVELSEFSGLCVLERTGFDLFSMNAPYIDMICFYKETPPIVCRRKPFSLHVYDQEKHLLVVPIAKKDMPIVSVLWGDKAG